MVDMAVPEEFGGRCREEGGEKVVKLALSKVLNETYLAVSTDSQFVYFRNYMKRIVQVR